MTERSAIPANDVEAAWRFFLFNWIVTGAMAATLALILAVTNFSIGLTGLLVAVGCGAVCWVARANARSPVRRDPQVMFVLGGSAQIALTTAVLARNLCRRHHEFPDAGRDFVGGRSRARA